MGKHIFLFFLFLFLLFKLGVGQLLLPKFSEPIKQEFFNSKHEESAPLPFNNGEGIYYSRTYLSGVGDNIKVTGYDFFVSSKTESGEWDNPYRVLKNGDIPGNNILVGTSTNGNRLYLLNTVIKKKKLIEKLVYIDKKGKNKWSNPVEVIIPEFTLKPEYLHFYVNPEETAILMSILPSQDAKGEDIYVVLKDTLTGEWKRLINLGTTINTDGIEIGSFLTRDLKTLYFSSNGHGGLGKLDIFVSYRLSDSWTEWTKPLNIGTPVNSKDDEIHYVIANNSDVYFISNRGDTYGNLYKAKATGELVSANDSVKGKFVYRGLPVDYINLIIEDEFGQIIDELITDEFGKFQFAKNSKLPINYNIKLKEKDRKEYIGSKIYLMDIDGKPIERFILTDEGKFISSSEVTEATTYEGVSFFKKQPLANTYLVVVDENSFPIDTLLTDEEGRFMYKKLKYDLGINVLPLDVEKDDFPFVELQLKDKETNSIFRLAPGVYLELISNSPAAIRPSGIDPMVREAPKLGKDKKEEFNLNTQQTIEFAFNNYTLNSSEKMKVLAIAELLKSDKSLNISLIGHTDNLGNGGVNRKLGQIRADEVKKQLLKQGIEASRITSSSEGEKSPKESNDTEQGRAKNRRVEMTITR